MALTRDLCWRFICTSRVDVINKQSPHSKSQTLVGEDSRSLQVLNKKPGQPFFIWEGLSLRV